MGVRVVEKARAARNVCRGVNATISELYSQSARAKIKAVQDYMQLLLDSGCKFLVFGHHAHMLDAIEEKCNRAGVK